MHLNFFYIKSSVANPDPGSGAFLTLDPGSGIGFFRIPDLGSQTHIFDSLIKILGIKYLCFYKVFLCVWLNNFFTCSKIKLFTNFIIFVATKE